jgi:Phage tail sheath protein subtilisin-like domain/Phage tail sheath C-terminal domain
MPFQISPGVNVSEIDLTTIVPAVSTTTGAFAGVFRWGPVNQAFLVSSEDELVQYYGKPTANNFETFFTAANFLGYGNQLYVSRAADSQAFNAFGNTGPAANLSIKNSDDYIRQIGSYQTNTHFVAKYPGQLGNSLKVSVCPTANVYHQELPAADVANTITSTSFITLNTEVKINIGQNYANVISTCDTDPNFAFDSANTLFNAVFVNDILAIGNTTIGTQYMQVASVSTPIVSPTNTNAYQFNIFFNDVLKLKSNVDVSANGANTVIVRNWEYFNSVNGAPGLSNYVAQRTSNTAIADEVHIVVADEQGLISGVPGQILEVWSNLSRATDAKGEQGGSIYYQDVLNNSSKYVWSITDYLGSASTRNNFPVSNVQTPSFFNFTHGYDGAGEADIGISSLATSYDVFSSAESIDISLVLTGKALTSSGSGEVLPNYLIDNIGETRRDCVVFVSPPQSAVVNAPGFETSNVVAFRNLLRSSSYAVIDSGYKYQYDKYNDLYRWVPLNGDIAGLCVRTDNTRDPWFSPAGFNRGQIKNVVKLAFNPNQANRDQLYKNGINPVVTFPGQGTVLYGDKTALATPSAFDRINVRRLFIVLEKAISTAAKFALFELNDDFTRAAFRNLVEPYLRDVQGRRGIYDFRVVCDTTNNTPEVIDANQFRGDIYIKPARSINFIQLNFVAVRTGVAFDEIVGKF